MKGLIEYVGLDSRYYVTAKGMTAGAVVRVAAGTRRTVVGTAAAAQVAVLAEAVAERERVYELNMGQLSLDISAARRTAKDARFPESGLPASAGVLVELEKLVVELEREKRIERKLFWSEISRLKRDMSALKAEVEDGR